MTSGAANHSSPVHLPGGAVRHVAHHQHGGPGPGPVEVTLYPHYNHIIATYGHGYLVEEMTMERSLSRQSQEASEQTENTEQKKKNIGGGRLGVRLGTIS